MQISDLRASGDICKKELQDKSLQLDLVTTANEGLEEELSALKRKIQTYRDGYEAGQSQMNKLQDLVDEKEGKLKVKSVTIGKHLHKS